MIQILDVPELIGEDDLRFLSPAEAHDRVGATDVLGGTFTPHCAAVDPARLVRGLADVVERQGVPIYERTTVRAIAPGVVTTDRGTVRAGTVVEPSCSMRAVIQHVMPSSRLVAESRKRPSSEATRMFDRTGSVDRGDTARETMPRPWARFSCKTVTFISQPSWIA